MSSRQYRPTIMVDRILELTLTVSTSKAASLLLTQCDIDATKRPAKSLASSRNHPLMRLFDDGTVVSANAAANAFGLGFPISSSSMDMRQSSSQAQVVIPNFPEDGDDDEPFLRTARKREDSLPNRGDMSSPTTLRAPGLPRANGSFSLAGMPPSPSLEAPPQHRRPSSPADSRPTSPSFPTPTDTRFPPDVQNQPVPTSPSMPTVQYGRTEDKRSNLNRSRANTAPSQDAYLSSSGSTPMAATNSAPANTGEGEKASPPALRRKGRSGTNTSDASDRPHGRKVCPFLACLEHAEYAIDVNRYNDRIETSSEITAACSSFSTDVP